jgi:hypothetical protein
MNLFKELYNLGKNIIWAFEESSKYIYYVPFIYINTLTLQNNKFYNFFKIYINGYYLYNIYTHSQKYLENAIVYALNFKIAIQSYYSYIFKSNNEFILEKVYLYNNLTQSYDITNYFKTNNISLINSSLIIKCMNIYSIEFHDEYYDDIRLKIIFYYKNKRYIQYFPITPYFKNDEYYIPYPIYNDEIIQNYRKDIIKPLFNIDDKNNKSLLYSLFSIDSKNIDNVKINNNQENIDYTKIIEYFDMIHSPFNDFGILYNTPIKLRWICVENNIDIDSLQSFYLRYGNPYFDETTFELKEHKIELNSKNDILISIHMKELLSEKNKELFL